MHTPATSGRVSSVLPIIEPLPGTNCSTASGTPASCNSFTAAWPISTVWSAGLAITALPAASAAATWPVNMASGKFHGLMQTNTPRPCKDNWFDSPVGPVSASGLPISLRATPA